MSSSLDRYVRALDGVSGLVDSAAAGRWDVVSPCHDWSARQLLGHVIDGQRQVVAMVAGQGPLPPVTDADALGRLTGGAPAAAWARVRDDTVAALVHTDLGDVVVTPLGRRAVQEVLDIAVIEPLVHGWDLAVATGRAITLDPEAVAATLPGVQALGPALAATGMYRPARAAPTGASDQDRLLAALGRDPSAAPSARRSRAARRRRGCTT